MTINYDQLSDIKNLNKFPDAKLQIVTKNRDEDCKRINK